MRDILLVYTTKSGNTRLIAEAIARGVREMDMEADVTGICDIHAEDVLRAKVVAIGSPTYEHSMLPPIARLLDRLGREDCRGKYGVAFGSYGWSGEAPLLIAQRMRELGFTVLDPVLRVQYEPNEKDVEACVLLGKETARQLKREKTQNCKYTPI